jgi:hypothetical protein
MFLTVNGSFPVASRTETLGGGDLEIATRFEITGKKGRLPTGRWELKRPDPIGIVLEVHK